MRKEDLRQGLEDIERELGAGRMPARRESRSLRELAAALPPDEDGEAYRRALDEDEALRLELVGPPEGRVSRVVLLLAALLVGGNLAWVYALWLHDSPGTARFQVRLDALDADFEHMEAVARPAELKEYLHPVVKVEPLAAVFASWGELERKILDLLETTGSLEEPTSCSLEAIRILESSDTIDADTSGLLIELRVLPHLAARQRLAGFAVSEPAATRYARVSIAMTERLQHLQDRNEG